MVSAIAQFEKFELGRTSEKAWKLTDHITTAVPVGMDIRLKESYLSVLDEDASLWVWDITEHRIVNGRAPLPYVIQSPKKIMEGVCAVMTREPCNSALWILKTNYSLWAGWRKGTHDTFPAEGKDFEFEKKMDGVHAAWVNPVYNAQVYTLRANDELFAFGENGAGQLGVGFKSGSAKHVYHDRPTKVTDSVASVITQREDSEAYMLHVMALKKDHSLWLWGRDIMFESSPAAIEHPATLYLVSYVPVNVMDDVASGALGVDHCLAIVRDGSLLAWGYNYSGQVGTGDHKHVKVPVKIMDSVVSVTASNRHSLALQIDGSLWAWGDNKFGQLGTGDTTSRLKPTKIMEDVTSIFTNATCNAAVKRDGSVWIWGNTSLYPGSFVDEENSISILEPICILEE